MNLKLCRDIQLGSKPYLYKMNDSNPSDNRFYLLNGEYTIMQKSTGAEYKIPVDGVTDGYVILDIDDVVRQSGTSGFEFTNLPPGEYKIAEIVPQDGKYQSPPELTYGGDHSNVNITDDVPNAVIADAIKPYSRYKEVELELKAHDYVNNIMVTSFTNPYFMIYEGTEMVAFLVKDSVSGAYVLSNTYGSVTLNKINSDSLPYLEYITDKGIFCLLEGNYTLIQAEADADYSAPMDMNGNSYSYELAIPEHNHGSKVNKEAYNYQTIGSVSGFVISKRDNTEVLGDVFIGIFPAGTTLFTTDNLCNMIEVRPGEYIIATIADAATLY